MSYVRVGVAALAAGLLKAFLYASGSVEVLAADVHGVGAYLGVLGGLYSIIAAFLIYVVWEQYNRVQIGLAQEAAALEDLCRVSNFVQDKGQVRSIRAAVRLYMESTAGDEARRLAKGETSVLAEEHFEALCHAVRAMEIVTLKDEAIYAELLRALTRTSDARDARLSVSATRIPRTLWNLVVFASLVLVGGFLALGLRSFLLSVAIPAAVAGTLVFLLTVIQDMDNPFEGAWNVSYAPLKNMAARIALRG